MYICEFKEKLMTTSCVAPAHCAPFEVHSKQENCGRKKKTSSEQRFHSL